MHKSILLAVAMALAATPALAKKSCEELKGEIEAKLKAKGVKAWTIDIVRQGRAEGRPRRRHLRRRHEEARLQARQLALPAAGAGGLRRAWRYSGTAPKMNIARMSPVGSPKAPNHLLKIETISPSR